MCNLANGVTVPIPIVFVVVAPLSVTDWSVSVSMTAGQVHQVGPVGPVTVLAAPVGQVTVLSAPVGPVGPVGQVTVEDAPVSQVAPIGQVHQVGPVTVLSAHTAPVGPVTHCIP